VVTRTLRSAKQAGASFETLIANYLALHIDDRIERRRLTGAKDRGDLSGWRSFGHRVVGELKNYGGRVEVGPWLEEAEIERGNDDALVGLVIAKRRGVTAPGRQIVMMTVDDLIALTTGVRP
jgi:hypothetical protein